MKCALSSHLKSSISVKSKVIKAEVRKHTTLHVIRDIKMVKESLGSVWWRTPTVSVLRRITSSSKPA